MNDTGEHPTGEHRGDENRGNEYRGDEYRGEAVVRVGDVAVTVAVRLSARFEPVEGRYRWAGRAAPDETLTGQQRAGIREATVRIGDVGVPARLGEPDPWGRIRLTGVGHPPWSAAAGE